MLNKRRSSTVGLRDLIEMLWIKGKNNLDQTYLKIMNIDILGQSKFFKRTQISTESNESKFPL